VVARRASLFGLIRRTVTAPIDGVLAPEQGGYGNLAVVAAGEGEGVVAHFPGTVVGILPDQGVVIETTGLLVSGAVGFGPAVRGPLLPPSARLDGALQGHGSRPRGAIAVLDVLDRTQLELLRASGAAGAVVGSVAPDLADELWSSPPELGIVAVEGIGRAPLCAPACALLAGQAGELACLTPDQADVVVPVQVRGARLAPDLKLARGSVVRVAGESTELGEVAAVGSVPSRLSSGVWTRLAEVDLESGERKQVPLANLELVS
jgi:hypothetical protein